MQIFALLRIVQVPPCVSVQREEFPDSTCKCNGWFRVGLF